MRSRRRREAVRGATSADRTLGCAAVSVLQRKQLEDSPLADLHAIASELGLEGFRTLRRDDLIAAILAAQGGEEEEATPAAIEEPEPDEVPPDESLEGPSGLMPAEPAPAPSEAAEAAQEPEAPAEPEPAAEPEAAGPELAAEPERAEPEPAAEREEPEEKIASGVLDILANGSGFVRVQPGDQSRDDVYVAPAQIRRCELRAGDQVSGPVRPPRRNERHPSLVRVERVNGADAEPPEQRPWFGDLTPVFAR